MLTDAQVKAVVCRELKKAGMSKRDLAKAMGVTEQHVYRWLDAGSNKNARGVTPEVLARMVEAICGKPVEVPAEVDRRAIVLCRARWAQ